MQRQHPTVYDDSYMTCCVDSQQQEVDQQKARESHVVVVSFNKNKQKRMVS